MKSEEYIEIPEKIVEWIDRQNGCNTMQVKTTKLSSHKFGWLCEYDKK